MSDSQPPQQRGAMEDSPAEFVVVDILAEAAEKKLQQQRDLAAYARECMQKKQRGEEYGATPPDHSFYTEGDKGVRASAVVKGEAAWHRMALYDKARGLSNREVAAKYKVSTSMVILLTHQPWFREQMEAVIEEEGRESLRSVLEGEGLNSIYTLIDVRDNEEAKGSERVAAANSLLDRLMGKAPQTVQHVDGGRSEAAKTQDRLERELKEVEDAIKLHGAE